MTAPASTSTPAVLDRLDRRLDLATGVLRRVEAGQVPPAAVPEECGDLIDLLALAALDVRALRRESETDRRNVLAALGALAVLADRAGIPRAELAAGVFPGPAAVVAPPTGTVGYDPDLVGVDALGLPYVTVAAPVPAPPFDVEALR